MSCDRDRRSPSLIKKTEPWRGSSSGHGCFARPVTGDAARTMGPAGPRLIGATRPLAYRDSSFCKFEELAKLRAKENLEEQIKLPTRFFRASAPWRKWRGYSRTSQPMSPVLVGNDQMEVSSRTPIFQLSWCASVTASITFRSRKNRRSWASTRHRNRGARSSRAGLRKAIPAIRNSGAT